MGKTATNIKDSSQRDGVTLLELLVVIAVIGVLIAIIVPSLSGARNNAAALRCQANLRQWGTAVIIYAQNNDSWLPRRGQGAQATSKIDRADDWFNCLPPMLGQDSYLELVNTGRISHPGDNSFWMCPKAKPGPGPNYFAYSMNMRLSVWSASRPDCIDSVAPTDRQVFMTEGPGDYCAVLPSDKPFSPVARHENAINIAFLDGHVARFSGKYVGCGSGDPRRGDVQWLVPNSQWTGPGGD